ncbi:MAG: hypothetical protein WDN47_02660 [Candidatus Doudnabacteria bacterium]
MKDNPVAHSLGHAVLVLLYVTLVASIMNHGSVWFGQKDTAFTPILVLMLFVLSAAITSALVLGRPVLMYFDGQKKEALKFFGYTVGWMFALTVVVFAVMVASK